MEMIQKIEISKKIQVKWIYKVGASNMLQTAILFFLKLGFEILENVQLWLKYNLNFASNVEQIYKKCDTLAWNFRRECADLQHESPSSN